MTNRSATTPPILGRFPSPSCPLRWHRAWRIRRLKTKAAAIRERAAELDDLLKVDSTFRAQGVLSDMCDEAKFKHARMQARIHMLRAATLHRPQRAT